jgi:ACT domain-containing protein
MENLNNPEFKQKVLDKLEKDGVNLKEFNEEQQRKIIITYAAVLLNQEK